MERLEKQKKQNESYNLRVQELKKINAADQAELKEMRVKLRNSEHERVQLLGKHDQVGETKKALQSLESKRRDEMRERDKKIVELEKVVVAEKKKRGMLEACLHDVKSKADEEVVRLRGDVESLRVQLDMAQRTSREAQKALCGVRDGATSREKGLVARLGECKTMLSCVAEEYGRLASTTVTAHMYEMLKTEHTVLEMHVLRQERRLANTQDQVVQLSKFVHQAKEENTLLRRQLEETQKDMRFYIQALDDRAHDAAIDPLDDTLMTSCYDVLKDQLDILELGLENRKTDDDLHRLYSEDMEIALEEERSANKAMSEEMKDRASHRAAADAQVLRLQSELTEANQMLSKEQLSVANARRSANELQEKVTRLEGQLRKDASRHEETEKKGREVIHQLGTQLGMAKTSEEALNVEIER